MLFIVAALTACGGKKDSAPEAKKDGASAPSVPPIATPTLGVIDLPPWSFPYNAGHTEYDKALAASRGKTVDWAAVRKGCEAAIKADAEHYDAHRLLATALVQTGEPALAVDELVKVLAVDYYRYAPGLAEDANLDAFMKTPHGQAIHQLVTTIGTEYARRIATGVWLVGRRSTFKWPKAGAGASVASTRGEVYAFDRETKRYLRLTHTEHQVAGFVRSPDGKQILIVGFDKAERGAEPDAPPLISRAWVQTIETAGFTAPFKRAVIAGPLRQLHAGWTDALTPAIETSPAAGRWGIGEVTIQTLEGGKLQAMTGDARGDSIVFTLDEGVVQRSKVGVDATWGGDPPTTAQLQLGTATIRVPESGAAAQATVSVAPGGGHVAFATAVDPCTPGVAPSLYVADAKGALTHVLTAKSRFDTRWVDATTLAYDDGEGAIRVWDATTGREAMKIANPEGIALDVLSQTPGPICKQGAAVIDAGSGSGSADAPDTDEPLPPEEGAGGGPIVTPP